MAQPSIRETLRVTSNELRAAGIEDARAEARILIKWVTGLTGAELIANDHLALTADQHSAWLSALAHRKARKPFAHLEGYAHFYGIRLRSDGRALIPRPDSEIVVDLALSFLPTDRTWTLADLGTGTGALMAALLIQRPVSIGTAVERNRQAADLAAENFAQLNLGKRARLFQGSWADWTGWQDCDLVISNPPYIESAVIPTLEPEVRDHDPADALDGGADGLNAYREIIGLAAEHMRSGTHLVLEIGYDQRSSVSALLQAAGFIDLHHRKDLCGQDRAIAAKRP